MDVAAGRRHLREAEDAGGGKKADMSTRLNLLSLLQRCQDDTLEILGASAASRLSHWQQYAEDQSKLVRFIHDRLLMTRENGYTLERMGKLSLERIVVHHHPKLFTQEDIEIAQATLGGKV